MDEDHVNTILREIKKVQDSVTNIEKSMATKADIDELARMTANHFDRLEQKLDGHDAHINRIKEEIGIE